ncbi:MAG: 30S ribosomal protein S17 [Nitrososphaerota archaeon]|nr:30S ribosomal protein S17 [Candidatus Calditenuaceae archaeon]MDW8072948.1 30S ribosomal protein S17 [Nitrososphaerota archaeon]
MSSGQVNNIGIGVHPPRSACDDENCPFHGSLRVRGIILTGRVYKKLMKKAVVVERVTTQFVRKYKRYMRKRSRISAHLPPCIGVEVGDMVRIAETRPISKTISFVVIENLGRGGENV